MSRMTAQSCGSVRANAGKVRFFLEGILASSNGQPISAKKKEAKPDYLGLLQGF